ncbi:hypothetical protein HB816_08765 [Listeria booriae]|uniref:hypothetical protein n=1 Tax=Listeria booriae TaxID=1552123 RepID=UPI001624484C|nr:hypothetical protein [Listeria booriae]MBC1230534.1 hypothetical protein [Listeria booriae]
MTGYIITIIVLVTTVFLLGCKIEKLEKRLQYSECKADVIAKDLIAAYDNIGKLIKKNADTNAKLTKHINKQNYRSGEQPDLFPNRITSDYPTKPEVSD